MKKSCSFALAALVPATCRTRYAAARCGWAASALHGGALAVRRTQSSAAGSGRGDHEAAPCAQQAQQASTSTFQPRVAKPRAQQAQGGASSRRKRGPLAWLGSTPDLQRWNDVAHHFWELSVRPGDTVIDATCGNGHDTVQLLGLVTGRSPRDQRGTIVRDSGYQAQALPAATPDTPLGSVLACDVSEEAVVSTRRRVAGALGELGLGLDLDAAMDSGLLRFQLGCHSAFPEDIPPHTVSLVVYNLGWLPRSSKEWTTKTETTLASIRSARRLLKPGGMISILCYVGHGEGAREGAAVEEALGALDRHEWGVANYRLPNVPAAPVLYLLQRRHPDRPDGDDA
eukprot:tig00020961_g16727.t1